MEPKANPIRKRGERNIYCPFYNDCLDYAIKWSWKSWSCSQCPHKLTKQSITAYEWGVTDPEPYYDLPAHVIRERAKDSSD